MSLSLSLSRALSLSASLVPGLSLGPSLPVSLSLSFSLSLPPPQNVSHHTPLPSLCRRLMTEMLLQFNSLGDQVVVVAATNRIHDIDPALLRRFERKV